ncbi:MAG: extracellular solute-binding protein [Desulfobacterales bacterium]|nr:extracellular solute-binding protein [Desulfobacterales bacterium]
MKKAGIIFTILMVMFSGAAYAADNELVVYSARKEHLIKDLFEKYEKEQGVKVKYITGKAAVLLQRILSEGENTDADILLTVDAGNLWHAAQKGVLAPVSSEVLDANIPSHYRDPDNLWFGLSVRARTLVYNTGKVKKEDLSTYEGLAAPAWKDRLLLRTSKKVYNQSLVAMLIATLGEEKTREVVEGWVNNLAAPPYSSDTKVLEAIAAGQGDVGVVNTYYYARLMKKNPDLPLGIFWADQADKGVHVNVSGAGVLAHSKNKAQARRFIEWLSGTDAQKIFADANMEYPVNESVSPHEYVRAWGAFKENKLNLAQAGKLQADAIKLMDMAGYK